MMNNIESAQFGLIFAGGRGMRMGGVDKALILHEGRPLISHITDALKPFCEKIYISRQRDQVDLSAYGQVLYDLEPDQGPLGALYTFAKTAEFGKVLTAPVDTAQTDPSLFSELLKRMNPHAVLQSKQGLEPTFCAIDLQRTAPILEAFERGERSLRSWMNDEVIRVEVDCEIVNHNRL